MGFFNIFRKNEKQGKKKHKKYPPDRYDYDDPMYYSMDCKADDFPYETLECCEDSGKDE